MTYHTQSLSDNEKWLGRVMIAPAIVYIIALVGFPFFLALYYSVSNITVGSTEMAFLGLDNFRHLLNN